MSENDIANYLMLRIEEATARLNAVATVLSQPSSKGTAGETALRDVIRGFLPVRSDACCGFVVEQSNSTLEQSRQVDILVYDHDKSVPLYKDGFVAVVTKDMPRLAIESKMTMNKSQLAEALTNIASVKVFNSTIQGLIWSYRGMELKTVKKHLLAMLATSPHDKWPDHIFNLHRGYVISKNSSPSPGNNWTVLRGKASVARVFFQAILFGANVQNLTPFIDTVQTNTHELF